MHIDRSRFLALTTLIAGCGAGRDIRQVIVVDVPAAPTVDAGGDAAPLAKKPMAVLGDSEAYPPAEAFPIDEDRFTISTANHHCGDPFRKFNASKTGCADTIGKPLTCKSPGPSSGAGSTFGTEKCIAYAQSMLPGVARRAQTCVAKLGNNPDSCEIYRCGNDALMDACLTPKATAACKRVGMQNDVCHSYLSGLNDIGIKAVEACMKGMHTSPNAGDLYSCIESL